MGSVFRSELNWSTYQDEQLKTLKKLESSFQDSLVISKNIQSAMHSSEKFMSDAGTALTTMTVILDKVDRSISAITEDLVKDFKSTARDYTSIVKEMGIAAKEYTSELKKSASELDNSNIDNDDENRKRNSILNYISKDVGTISRQLIRLGEKAEVYSSLSNNLMRFSGASGQEVRDTRETIVQGITDAMNSDIGKSYFNPNDVYKSIVSIANATGIGDLDVLKEITRPVMLASESMDINMQDISKLLGRWNSRYNFSSMKMEELVNGIKKDTAGNMASAEKTVENLATLDNMIAVYAGGDENKMKQMAESISAGTARLESMGIDTSRYTGYLKDIATGDFNTNQMLISVLANAGISNSQASKMFANGQIDQLYDALYQGELSLAKSLNIEKLAKGGSVAFSQAAGAYGINPEDLFDVYASSLGNYTSLSDFKENAKSAPDTLETLSDKWVSWTDRLSNWLEKFFEKLAAFQEATGVSLADIGKALLALVALQGIKGVVSAIGGAFKSGGLMTKIGSVLGLGSASSGAAGGSILASLGSVAGTLGAAGAVGLAVGGIALAVKSVKDLNEKMEEYQRAEFEKNFGDKGFRDQLSEDNVAVVKKKADGTFTKGFVSREEYNKNKSVYDELEKAYAGSTREQDGKDVTLWDKVGDFFATGANNAAVNAWKRKGFKPTKEMEGIKNEGSYAEYKYKQGKKDELDLISLSKQYSNHELDVYRAYADAFEATGSDKLGTNAAQTKFLKDINKYVEAWDNGKVIIDGKEYDRSSVEGFAKGSNYIEEDQLAILHEGEAVVPKKYNPSANMTELEMLRKQSQMNSNKQSQEENETQKYLKETVVQIKEIHKFLREWKSTKECTDIVNNNKNRFHSQIDWMAGYNR